MDIISLALSSFPTQMHWRHEEILCISLKCSLCAALFYQVLCFINFCCLWYFWTRISIPQFIGTAVLHLYSPLCTTAQKLCLSSRWQAELKLFIFCLLVLTCLHCLVSNVLKNHLKIFCLHFSCFKQENKSSSYYFILAIRYYNILLTSYTHIVHFNKQINDNKCTLRP